MRKPVDRHLNDLICQCIESNFGLQKFIGVRVDGVLLNSDEVRKLIRFLEIAEKWMKKKEGKK